MNKILNSTLPAQPIGSLGYDSRYIFYPEGYIINSKTGKQVKEYKGHKFSLRRADGSWATVGLRPLF